MSGNARFVSFMLGVLLILVGFAIVIHVLGAPPYASVSMVFGVSGIVVIVWGFRMCKGSMRRDYTVVGLTLIDIAVTIVVSALLGFEVGMAVFLIGLGFVVLVYTKMS